MRSPADRGRLGEVRRARAEQAARYFAAHAADWDQLRALHVPRGTGRGGRYASSSARRRFNAVLDLGTGTGRMLELVAPRAGRAPSASTNRRKC